MKVKNYTQFFETIKQSTPLEEYKKIFHPQAKFKDPFNEVIGVEKIYAIFQDMYKKLDDPKFTVKEAIGENNVVYLQWEFSFYFKKEDTKNSFTGVSRVEFNDNEEAISHIDYWDSGENVYEKIPFLSFFIKLIKKKINA